MTENTNDKTVLATFEQARSALSRLPILGPAMWLYARDPAKKFMFIGDADWALLPPLVLDQCRLFTRNDLPYAFVAWALVDEQVEARLRAHHPRIAPHEWNCGDRIWIVDAVAPFGLIEETLRELRETAFAGKKVCALLPDSARSGAVAVHEWLPASLAAAH